MPDKHTQTLGTLMDSKGVNKAIRASIRPVLKKDFGFTRFDQRNCWRHHDNRVDCIKFWSPYNWMAAEVRRITTISFQVHLGIYFLDIPLGFGNPSMPRKSNGRLLPPEHWCHFRNDLQRTLNQPEHVPSSLWYVDEGGTNLTSVLNNVLDVIVTSALTWFDRFSNHREVLRTLIEDDPGYGFGAIDSPSRLYQTGYIALSLGLCDLALESFTALLNTGRYDQFTEQLDLALHENRC